jgi:hypothetical protein
VIRSPHFTITTLPSDVDETNASIILDHTNFIQAIFPFADLYTIFPSANLDAPANGEIFVGNIKVIYPLNIVHWHAF